ncbi:Protein F25D7.5 [Aphelenchoides avenae]|nr:Protein F25D7.5 [Aphelenchus avenae]
MSCEQECQDGWTPGKRTDCYKFLDASISSTTANWTYLDFDQACTAIGQSQVYVKDFEDDDLYDTFARLSSQSASKNKFVYAQTLPTSEYRQQRTVQYVDLSVNVYLRREVGTVANNALLPNISAICRKPKFCADNTCKVADYFDEDVPQTRYLKTMKNMTSLQPGETIMVGCTTKQGQVKLTCNQRGYLQPHPSTLDCLSKNETSPTNDAVLPNIRVKNCTQCFKMGTENCTQGDGFAVCECKPGWRSSICLFTEDFCSADPCLNGGTCENDVDDYLCHCRAGYKGRRLNRDRIAK